MRRIPLSEVYGTGVTLDIDTDFYDYTEYWQPMTDVSWERGVHVPPAHQDALATVATQFHFGKLTDIKLCGRILEHEPDMNAKRLALLLSSARVRDVDAWGRYLDLLEATGEILPPLETYMSAMYDDSTDPVSLLIGMIMIGDISGSIILDEAMQTDESVLQEMAPHMADQSATNRESAITYLRPVLRETHPNRLTKIQHDVQQYRKNLEDILRTQEDAFTTLGWNTDHIANRATDEADLFLEIITTPEDT